MSKKHNLPWHRVIRSDGSIALSEHNGGAEQAELLRAEKVAVSESGRVSMKKYAWMNNHAQSGQAQLAARLGTAP